MSFNPDRRFSRHARAQSTLLLRDQYHLAMREMSKPEHSADGRCRPGVVALNILVCVLAVLDLPIALIAPMGVGMTEGSAGHHVLWAEAFGVLAMAFPIICAACVYLSIRYARFKRHKESVLVSAAPLLPAAAIVALMITHWDS